VLVAHTCVKVRVVLLHRSDLQVQSIRREQCQLEMFGRRMLIDEQLGANRENVAGRLAHERDLERGGRLSVSVSDSFDTARSQYVSTRIFIDDKCQSMSSSIVELLSTLELIIDRCSDVSPSTR
jgi:hypothetical protein